MRTPRRSEVEAAVKRLGYKWFENGDYNVNIVGIRNSDTGSKVTNLFDDWITISWKEQGKWCYQIYAATTEPGKKGMLEGKAKGGVFILKEGQYRGSHEIGLHLGKYKALRQCGALRGYRDGDRDLEFDLVQEQEVWNAGVNIHKAGKNSTYVENWSEGCQVFKIEQDFNEFMKIIEKAATIYGDRFTYTLIGSKDITFLPLP
jgi:hypothetical protein